MKKVCNKCKMELPISYYCKHSSTADKRSNICRDCKNINQKIKRSLDGNAHTLKYEKSKSGFLVRTYRNMLSRVTGIQIKKAYLYYGKSILDKNAFYEWSKNDKKFNELFDVWQKSQYVRKLTPSIDREDSQLGYEIGNIRWVTFSENCRLGSISRWTKIRTPCIDKQV